jgi:hypothetical protein
VNRRLFVSSMIAAVALPLPKLFASKDIKPWSNQKLAQDWLTTASEDDLLACKCAFYSKGEIIFEKDTRYCNRINYPHGLEIEWTINPAHVTKACIVEGCCLIRPDGLNITQSLRQGKIARFEQSHRMNPGDTLKCTYFTVHRNGRWNMEHYS